MRIVVMTVVAVAWLALPAQAQEGLNSNASPGRSLPGMGKPPKEEESHVQKADEKAYKSALDGIQAKQNYDPWRNMREKPQSNNSR